MKDLKCPNCGTVFQVDENDYAAIVAQVRSAEFEADLKRRAEDLSRQFDAREEAVRLRAEKDLEARLAQKDRRLAELQTEITRLQGVADGFEARLRSEISDLKAGNAREFADFRFAKEREIADLKAGKERELADLKADKERELFRLSADRDVAIGRKDTEIAALKSDLEAARIASENREARLREQHQLQLRDKQDEIDRLKDFKMRLSTKMVGENLEQHCAILFEKARSMGMYPEAIFEKDNIAVDHSKGDFIFRDFVEGQEYVSIMFEMKNEVDTTATKHRNDDFLDKLDKDRTRKNCEYAVLVSMLEQDSELYNAGIVDKSYLYPKMIVIRPQFFLPVLRLISEAARKGFTDRALLRRQLEDARSQSVDFARFEEKLQRFKSSFSASVIAAHKKFDAATTGIDKTIEALEKQIKALRDIKANFEAAEQKLLRANHLADEDLTVKKLTHGNPSIRRLIEEAASRDHDHNER